MSSDPGASSRHLVTYADGEHVFTQGETGDEMYIVQDGQVEIVLQAEDGEVVSLATLERGDFFGEMAVIEGAPRTATARSKGGCKLLPLRGALFIEMLQRDPETTLRIMRKLCGRIRDLESRLTALQDDRIPLVGEAPPSAVHAVVVPDATRGRLVHETGVTFELPNVADVRVGRPDSSVGSVPHVDLTPLNQARTVSRSHAHILNRDGRLSVVAEAGAANGTFVNGERLEPGVAREVHAGDSIKFGTVALALEIG